MTLRSAVVAVCLVALAAPLRAQEGPWVADQTAVSIPMRDGKSLAADVWLPAKPGRYPAVVVQTPYDRKLQRWALEGMDDRRSWDREHYAYVVADWRGFFGSRAAGPARPGQRGQDGFDVVEWTAAQTWSDGKVGTWGPSALGRVQLDTAAERPPHLVCCVPLVAPIGQSYDDYYEGGVYKEAHVAKLDALGFGVGTSVHDRPDPDAPAWKLAKRLARPERIDVPMLFITGWFDHATARELDTFRTLLSVGGSNARDGSRLLVGPWHHVAIDQVQQGDLAFPAAAGEAAREVRAFLDFHLRGVADGGWAARPRVRVWRCNEEGWHGGTAWPFPAAVEATWTLHASGVIDRAESAIDEAARRYLDDPASPVPTVGGANLPAPGLLAGPRDQAPLLGRDDVLVWTTAPLAAPLRLDGVATLSVFLACDKPDTDLAVRLCEVLADGRTMLLGDAIQRASFRNAPVREPLVAGQPSRMTVTLPPLAVTFPKGARLTLILAGTNWPRFERNGHDSAPHLDPAKARPAKVEILHDAAHPARLVLPLLPPPVATPEVR